MAARRINGENVKLYTTGDVSRILGVPISTQKEWERSGYLPPNCEPGRRRKYSADDVKRLIQVRELTDRYRFRERVLAALARGEALPSRLPVAFGGSDLDGEGVTEDKERLLDLAAKNAALFADQRRLVKELEATEIRYRTLVERSPDIIIRLDNRGIVNFVNHSVSRYGFSPEQFIGRALTDVIDEEMVLLDRGLMERVLRGEVAETLLDAQINTGDGETIYLAVTAVTVFDDGQATGVIAFARDITKRKKIESALKRYKLLFDRAQDIALFVGLDGRICDANDAAVRAYGYSKQELCKLTVFDLEAGGGSSSIPAQMAESDAKGLLFETWQKRKEGTLFPVEISSIGAMIDGERVLLTIVRDITERKKAEEGLKNSESLFRMAFEEAPVGIWMTTLDGKIVAGNSMVTQMLGYTTEETASLGVQGITAPEDYEEERRQYQRLLNGEATRFQMRKRYVAKNGELKDALVTVSLATTSEGGNGLAIAVIEESNGRGQPAV